MYKFWDLRNQQAFTWRKIPGTSELLDWILILKREEQLGNVTAKALKEAAFAKLPALDALIKTEGDLKEVQKLVKKA